MKKSFLSRIYVYVSCDGHGSEAPRTVNIENANGTTIAGGLVDSQAKLTDCLSVLGCTELRLPDSSEGREFMRVMTDVRPRDLESALALIN